MAEASEEVQESPDLVDLPQDRPPETLVVPSPDEGGDEGKPGGDDPQAVRARREYQARKKAEQERESLREQNIRLEERLRTIEQQRTQPKQEKIWSIAEINVAVEAGTINRADADRYIEETVIPHRIRTIQREENAKVAQQRPVADALKYVDDYIERLPALADKTSEDFKKVAVKYNELVEMGLPDDARTQKVALDMVHGDLDTRRRKAELANLNARPRTIPADGGSGGSPIVAGKIDVSKAPPTMQADWEREGADSATRERRYRIYLDLKAQKAARQ